MILERFERAFIKSHSVNTRILYFSSFQKYQNITNNQLTCTARTWGNAPSFNSTWRGKIKMVTTNGSTRANISNPKMKTGPKFVDWKTGAGRITFYIEDSDLC